MASSKDEENEKHTLQDHWYLVDTHGQKFRLPKTMLFLGREECDVVVASQSVDKRHAVLTFDLYLNRFKVKDLSTTNGTYVNNSRIPEEEYVTLNHMDSVRLGQDAMLYHIEQGTQITSHGGQLPDPHYTPSWASRTQDSTTVHVHAHAFPECQLHYIGLYGWFPQLGCVAEQKTELSNSSLKLEHKLNSGDTEMADTKHLSHHHSEQHQQEHNKEYQHSTQPSKLTHYANDAHHSSQISQHSDKLTTQLQKSSDANKKQNILVEDQTSVVDKLYDQSLDTSTNVGRNTWPRKRQAKQLAAVFHPEESENSGMVTSEAHPAGSVQTMFFVTFEDSVCNENDNSSQENQERRLRSNRILHPSELATVKKGTPLYGQPSWWGEVEGDAASSSSSKLDGENNSSKNSRPTNLGLKGSEGSGTTKSGAASRTVAMESEQIKRYSCPTYMEIPIKDDDSPERVDKVKDIPTPAKSVSSSLSKDSLSVSPELKQPNRNAKVQSCSPDVNPSTSFTIDLDDTERPPKKSLNIGSSISEFVPSKIRKNFRERKAMSSKTSSKESTPSRNSEEQDLSPLSQRKIDEIWSTAAESKGKSWLSGVQTTAGTSLRSPNLEDIDRLSEFSDERRSLDRESDKRGSLKRPVSNRSPQLSSKAASSSNMGTSSRSPAGVSVVQYADPTSYLIDRMFEGGTSGAPRTEKQQSPELHMHRETASYDKIVSSRRSTEKASVIHRPIIDSRSSLPAAAMTKSVRNNLSKTAQQPAIDDSEDYDDNDLRITEDIPDNRVDEKDDKEDKTSEAGTYTIEADVKEGKEEEEARKRIDQVFGVDVENFNADRPLIDPLRLASPGGYDNVYDTSDDGERTPLDENCQSPVDDDADLTVEDDEYDGELSGRPSLNWVLEKTLGSKGGWRDVDHITHRVPTVNEEYLESSDMAATDGVQTWVSQLTALTNQKSADANKTAMEDCEQGDASLSKKPPQGISRKRPGTGRKLPTLPSDKSPVSSEYGSNSADLDFSNGEDVSLARIPNHTVSGRNSADNNSKSKLNSSQSRSRTISNGHPESPCASTRSRGSVDTEVLLQDTETVMAAIQARLSHKSNHNVKDSYNHDSDTDVSSTVALVNGDENFVKPTLYKSPRDALAQRRKSDLAVKSGVATSTIPVSPGKKAVVQSSKSVASPRSTPSASSVSRKSAVSDVVSTPPASGTRKPIVSDVVSRRDSMDNDSIISDVSSDTGDANFPKSSSKGKGTITMTRTNKTFDLRRARVDSFEEPATSRSGKSSASSRSNANSSFGRSQSLHSTTRNRSLTTGRSDATSLGAQIVKKSQSNIAEEKTRKSGNTSASRNDSGLDRRSQGQRLQHSNSLATSHPVASSTGGKKEPPSKPNLRLTPTNKAGLTITGISSVSSRSQSQPGSRSNSPKAAEKMAWKRRKEYDARKSVADAKASKPKDSSTSGVTMRPKPSANSNIKRRMIRSASYTNSAALSSGIHNSVSSSQNLSERRDSYNQHEDFRRAFIPFHNSLRIDRSTHSADEDDSLVSTNSTQDFTRSLASLLGTPSAFTPQPHRHMPVSQEISPPSKAYLSLRRRTLNMEGSPLSAQLKFNGHIEDIRQSPQTSYDTLIVASIYQLSLKLKTSTDKILSKLRDQNRVSLTPSPIDDFLSDSSKSEMTAWKTANQELAGTLKNLRKLERHVNMMNTVIFYDADVNSEASSDVPASRQVKQRLLEDIERKFGFQPIDHPDPEEGDFASPEMEEFIGQF